MATPIWKDYIATLGSTAASEAEYSVKIGNTTIYDGKAYTRPSDSFPTSRLNDIVAPQLTRGLTILNDTDTPYVTASLYVEGELQAAIPFHADYSYDDDFDSESDALNTYPSNVVAAGQYVPCTMADNASATFQVYTSSSTSTRPTIANGGVYQTAWLNLASYSGAIRVIVFDNVDGVLIRRKTYTISSCIKYALYYVNAYGGWDTLAIQGKVTESDDVTRYTTRHEYDNSTTSTRGSSQYVNALQHKYVIHTHAMPDAESLLMHHLINSPLVYLHDLVNGLILPINITDTTTEYKATGKLQVYTINAELARERVRR